MHVLPIFYTVLSRLDVVSGHFDIGKPLPLTLLHLSANASTAQRVECKSGGWRKHGRRRTYATGESWPFPPISYPYHRRRVTVSRFRTGLRICVYIQTTATMTLQSSIDISTVPAGDQNHPLRPCSPPPIHPSLLQSLHPARFG